MILKARSLLKLIYDFYFARHLAKRTGLPIFLMSQLPSLHEVNTFFSSHFTQRWHSFKIQVHKPLKLDTVASYCKALIYSWRYTQRMI